MPGGDARSGIHLTSRIQGILICHSRNTLKPVAHDRDDSQTSSCTIIITLQDPSKRTMAWDLNFRDFRVDIQKSCVSSLLSHDPYYRAP